MVGLGKSRSSVSLLYAGLDVGAVERGTSPSDPTARLPLGCAVRVAVGRDVGPAVGPVPSVPKEGEKGAPRVPPIGTPVGVYVV